VDLTFNESESAFRDELRAWIKANHPGDEPAGEDEGYAFRRDWQRQLYEAGWAAVHWPSEFGGRDATLVEAAIFNEELARARAPFPANVLGLLLAGPTLMIWGTDEQKQRYLDPIMSGDEIWCQGFSEPEAGSDLASLKSKAVRDGDDWLVTGQKVWTSGAQYSKWCMFVARTDFDAPKHKGLTYFILDMEQEGVEVRPLRQITGDPEFNELLLENARIPAANVVGGEGNGWTVALTTLMNERAGLAFGLQVGMKVALDELTEELAASGKLDDPLIADKLGELHIKCEILRLTAYRGLTATMKYGQPGPEGSLTKWMWSQGNQELMQFATEALGPQALSNGSSWGRALLRSRGNSIEGGTTEVLKNIIAERVLGLPRKK